MSQRQEYIRGGGFLIWDKNKKPIKVTLEEHPVFTSEQDAIDFGFYQCKKCQAIGDDVHCCTNCNIKLCLDCDENEMPMGADDHTYCTPCVGKLFKDEDYLPELWEWDYVLFFIDSGEFEFERANYPYIYHEESVTDEYDETKTDELETWIPCLEIPEDKQIKLREMMDASDDWEVK